MAAPTPLLSVTETRDGWGHTFYSEINVVGRED